MELGLSKHDSTALKGVAILMMLFHHLFRGPWLYDGYKVTFFLPPDESFWNSIGQYCKICVSIFAFITGYGLYKSFSKQSDNKKSISRWTLLRIVKTMGNFWFIYILIFITTMCIDRFPLHTYVQDGQLTAALFYMLNDFLGLSNLFGTPTLCSEWWYMTAAIFFIVVVPAIYYISHAVGYVFVIAIVVAVPRILGIGYPGGANPYSFIIAVILGMIFAEYRLFEKISKCTPRNPVIAFIAHFLFWGILIIFSFYIHESIYSTSIVWELHYGVVPVFVICFCRYCLVRVPVLRWMFGVIGVHSMSMYLIHTLISKQYLHDFIYGLSDNFLQIFMLLFCISLLLAVFLDYIRNICGYDRLIGRVVNLLKTT